MVKLIITLTFFYFACQNRLFSPLNSIVLIIKMSKPETTKSLIETNNITKLTFNFAAEKIQLDVISCPLSKSHPTSLQVSPSLLCLSEHHNCLGSNMRSHSSLTDFMTPSSRSSWSKSWSSQGKVRMHTKIWSLSHILLIQIHAYLLHGGDGARIILPIKHVSTYTQTT